MSTPLQWEKYQISERGKRFVTTEQPTAMLTETALKMGKYNRTTKPEGLIHLGLSENKVVDDLVLPKVSSVLKIEPEDVRYFPFEGSFRFRNSLARFFERYLKPPEPICPDDIFVINGCAALEQCLASILCDSGDGILIPTPYYYAYQTDFTLQPGAVCYPVNLSSQADPGRNNPYELTVAKLEEALEKAKFENVRIRALVLCNPHNPLGIVYSPELVRQCLEFAQRHSLHVISDEIYMLTVYGDCQWASAASFQNVIDKNLLHIMYGFSKEFGLSGLRVGVLFSRNHAVIKTMKAISYYHAVPPIIQNSLQHLIEDYGWLDKSFVPTLHQRLRTCLALVSKELGQYNVPIVDAKAGLYVWVNFSGYLKPATFENEKALSLAFVQNGVFLAPGVLYASNEPGWFRIVFSTDLDALKIALQRIGKTLQEFGKSRDTLSSDEPSLEDLVGQLKTQIGQSDWLKENTAEKWLEENPQLAKDFLNARDDKS